MGVRSSWERIEGWLRAHAPEALGVLRDGATEADVDAAEERLGLVLPPALRESLLRHDGQEWRWPSLVEFGILMSLEQIVERAELYARLSIDDAEAADELEAGIFELDRAAGAGLLPRMGTASRLWPS